MKALIISILEEGRRRMKALIIGILTALAEAATAPDDE